MKKTNKNDTKDEISDNERSQKIQSLREMVNSAEKTIQSAKAMLLQLEGKKKTGRRRKTESNDDGEVVEGAFDGQIMIGTDGKQYPVPANYASKSKLVEGDILKLTITPDGSFIYKQIGPTQRRNAIGIVSQDEAGNYYILADGKPYKILLASVTYFKIEPGDEVAIVIPRDINSAWAAIENVLQKGKEARPITLSADETSDRPVAEEKTSDSILDEWTSDIVEIEEELKKDQQSSE